MFIHVYIYTYTHCIYDMYTVYYIYDNYDYTCM